MREPQTEQQEAIDLALQGKSFFLTGAAGTGKTFTLNKIVKRLKAAGKRVGVTASTALAASHFDESLKACTLHNLAGVKYDGTADGKGFGGIDVLVIDEISMINHTLFETIEEAARKILNSDLPMGGIQVIGCGDFYQLSSVESDHCFESIKWRKVFPNFVVLKASCRHDNLEFINILNKVRIGDTAGVKEYIDANCKRTNSDDFIYLYAQNYDANKKNQRKLELMNMPKIKYLARDSNAAMKSDQQNHCAPEELELCIGCPVVVTHEDELYNGLRGKVVGFTGGQPIANEIYYIGCNELSCPIVDFKGKIKVLEPFQFKLISNDDCYREQIPLSLNWAMTIHKAQGMSLDGCNIDLKAVSQLGQVYFALSRIKDPRQMFVSNFSPKNVRISDAVEAYYESLKPYALLPGEVLDPLFNDIFDVINDVYLGASKEEVLSNAPESSHPVDVHNETDLVTDEDILMSNTPLNEATGTGHDGLANSTAGDENSDEHSNSCGDHDVNHSNEKNHSDGSRSDSNNQSDHNASQGNDNNWSDSSHSDGNRERNLRYSRKHSFSQRFDDMNMLDIPDSDEDGANETYCHGEDGNETYSFYFDGEGDRGRNEFMTTYNSQSQRGPIFVSDLEEDSEEDPEEDEVDFKSPSAESVRGRSSIEMLEIARRLMLGSSDSEDYM